MSYARYASSRTPPPALWASRGEWLTSAPVLPRRNIEILNNVTVSGNVISVDLLSGGDFMITFVQ